MPPTARTPRSGEVLLLTRAASVQFIRPITVRVIRPLDWPTYAGWCWLDCYQLNAAGDATARRSLYVQPAGVRYLDAARPARAARPASGRARTAARRQPSAQPKGPARTGGRG